MKTIRSLEDLKQFREEIIETRKQKASLGRTEVIVSLGTCGIAAGALDTLDAIHRQVEANHLTEIVVSQKGC
ncbi:MAG: (2Fe-2S) ferredoxin domain-containing protein, partial [Chloroflexota bacterium]